VLLYAIPSTAVSCVLLPQLTVMHCLCKGDLCKQMEGVDAPFGFF